MAQMTLTLCTNRTPIVRAFHSGLQKGSLVQPSPFRLQNKCFYIKKTWKNISKTKDFKLRIEISSSTSAQSVEPCHHWRGSQYLGDEALKCPELQVTLFLELHKGFPPQITCRSIQMMHPYFSTEQNKANLDKPKDGNSFRLFSRSNQYEWDPISDLGHRTRPLFWKEDTVK